MAKITPTELRRKIDLLFLGRSEAERTAYMATFDELSMKSYSFDQVNRGEADVDQLAEAATEVGRIENSDNQLNLTSFRSLLGGAILRLKLKVLKAEALNKSEVREALANYAHEAWSGWMKYMFSKTIETGDGCEEIPRELVERWQRQAMTPYAELPENEKESDRVEADKMLAVINAEALRAVPE